MLKSLSIRDFVIVERLELNFERGFTALTGETGAGKSILVDALALALGDRADPGTVRQGAERAEIEVLFDTSAVPAVAAWLDEQGLDADPEQLILRRLIERSGRTRAFINGRTVPLAQMREAGEFLVDVHGQHEHQRLLRAEVQRDLLDAHGGCEEALRRVSATWREWQSYRTALAELERESATRLAERDQLSWQCEELQRLDLQAGEWDEVQQEQGRLAHAAALIEGAQQALSALSEDDDSALSRMAASSTRLATLAGYDPTLAPVLELLSGSEAQLQEVVQDLRRYRDRVELDPARLDQVERRLEAIHGTARKLRVAPADLPQLRAQAQARLAQLEAIGDAGALAAKIEAAEKTYRTAARALSVARRKAADRLGAEVSAAMADLALGVARFEVVLHRQSEGSAHGDERIEFLIATNAGMEPRPLAKVASGGELSRISLAIQVITSNRSAVSTLIFDEVDSGIGGAVAEMVGRKLRALGEARQVLCVTHLPQVAACARQQWTVAKQSVDGVTRTAVQVLDPEGRIEEIARMLGGTSITATSRRHAAEMLGAT